VEMCVWVCVGDVTGGRFRAAGQETPEARSADRTLCLAKDEEIIKVSRNLGSTVR